MKIAFLLTKLKHTPIKKKSNTGRREDLDRSEGAAESARIGDGLHRG